MIKRVFLFLIISSIAFSQEITIDYLFKKVENDDNSYETKIYKNTVESNNILIKDNKLGDFNGVNVSSNVNFVENLQENRERKYSRTIQNRVSYGPFFVNFNYVQSKNNYISYGVEKNLKDLFYSKDKFSLNKNLIKRELIDINYSKTLQNKKVELLNLYKDILNLQAEKNVRETAYKHYQEEYKKLKIAYNLGATAKINLDSVELELEDADLQNKLLETKLQNLYEISMNKYGIDLKNYSLKSIISPIQTIEPYLKKYKSSEIKKLDLNLASLEEDKKYSAYDSYMPDLIVSFERVDKNLANDHYKKDQNIVSLRFSKKLFSTDSDYKISKLNVENAKLDLEEGKRDIENEKLNLKNQYLELKDAAIINEKKLDIASKKYQIKEREHELNKISYLDVIDAYTNYLNQEIATKKAKNDLNAFIYQIIIRSE